MSRHFAMIDPILVGVSHSRVLIVRAKIAPRELALRYRGRMAAMPGERLHEASVPFRAWRRAARSPSGSSSVDEAGASIPPPWR